MNATRSKTSQRGFSLIELLIVVALLGIISAIAIPYLVAAQQAARAASAVSSLRIIHSSEASYRVVRGVYGDLAALRSSGSIADPSVAAGQKNLYQFTITVGADPTRNYTAIATPLYKPTVYHHYFVDDSGVLRSSIGSPATVASPALN